MIFKWDYLNGCQCNYWEVVILGNAYGNNILYSLLSTNHAQIFVRWQWTHYILLCSPARLKYKHKGNTFIWNNMESYCYIQISLRSCSSHIRPIQWFNNQFRVLDTTLWWTPKLVRLFDHGIMLYVVKEK
jgi:hypothetical protein